MVSEAYIVGAVRSPIGKRNGGLSAVHPVDLAAHVLRELIARTAIDPSVVEDVIMGCVSQVGPQAIDIARNAWLSAGLPENVPGVTIDRQCGSSQQAVHFAAQGVLSGTQDLVVAAGVESMSMVPMGSTVAIPHKEGLALPFGQGWRDRSPGLCRRCAVSGTRPRIRWRHGGRRTRRRRTTPVSTRSPGR